MSAKTPSFGAMCAALAKAPGWTAMERGILLILLERAEPSRGWSTSLGIRDIAALAGCGRSAVAECVAVAEASGLIVREGAAGLPQTTRIVPDVWSESKAPTRLPGGHHPLARRTPPACQADTPVRHTDTPVRHTDTPVRHTDTPVRHTDTPHVIGTWVRPLVAAPLSDPLPDPLPAPVAGAPATTRTHTRPALTPVSTPAQSAEPRPLALDLPGPARDVADLVALALACRPPIDARGRGRGTQLSPVEEASLARLAATHGVQAVEAVLLEHCGGAERPVAMAAARLTAPKAGPQRAHRDWGIYEQHGVERPVMREVAAGDF